MLIFVLFVKSSLQNRVVFNEILTLFVGIFIFSLHAVAISLALVYIFDTLAFAAKRCQWLYNTQEGVTPFSEKGQKEGRRGLAI